MRAARLPRARGRFKCPECGDVFTRMFNLKAHGLNVHRKAKGSEALQDFLYHARLLNSPDRYATTDAVQRAIAEAGQDATPEALARAVLRAANVKIAPPKTELALIGQAAGGQGSVPLQGTAAATHGTFQVKRVARAPGQHRVGRADLADGGLATRFRGMVDAAEIFKGVAMADCSLSHTTAKQNAG